MNDIINIQVNDIEEVVTASVAESDASNNVSVSEIIESIDINIDEGDEIDISASEVNDSITVLVEDADGNLSIDVVEQEETINVEVEDVGIKGDPGPAGVVDYTKVKGLFIDCVAGEILGGGRLVYVSNGKAYLYDANDESLADLAIGITTGAAAMDADVLVQVEGIFNEAGFGLTAGEVYFAALNGLLTTSPSTIVSQMVGVAMDSDNLKLHIQQSIITI